MILLFDIGRTKMRLATSEDGESISEPLILDTPADSKAGGRLFMAAGEDLLVGRKPDRVVGGMSRTVWSDLEGFRSEITWEAELVIENDSATVGLGEAVYGAGRGSSLVVYMTVSSGVGGARIVDQKIDVNKYGFEPGHQCIFMARDNGETENGVNLEQLVSGVALEERTGLKPYSITDQAVWTELARYLAYGLANTIVHWSPEVVVVGGSMMKKPGIDLDETRDFVREIVTIYPELPEIRQAKLGDIGGLYGALVLARS